MPNPQRYNHRNKALSEANTKVILASLKSGPKTMNELIVVTGLTRQTILKKIDQNMDVIQSRGFPKVYYIGEYEDMSTIATENVATKAKPKAMDNIKAAIVAGSPVVFFPSATHNDHSKFHDHILNSDTDNGFMNMYRAVKSKTDLDNLEHQIKTMYDLVQFRKTLKEFE